ncbi:heterokaryon incompatibility protein-domain-containing protein [Lasiosphaeria hispida]|uniref:Heterokaryon incompatibility protein-domain-containing protein n=1 Tax=Lasiosphaeria hispida TaxID=260671 RepID=A0AAJ0MBR6_9PEZI|nr:heterokaryon incompatibility protein-domain-containing protein [Lasiosphaeria hispida]
MEQLVSKRDYPGGPVPASTRLEQSARASQAKPTSDSPPSTLSYKYSPLPNGAIRLLRLIPYQDKNDPIQCRIFEYPLHEPSQGTHLYEALSYVWGSAENLQPIYIQPDGDSLPTGNNHQLHITTNLRIALSYLRDPLLERIIWIDAICIDQHNNKEKEQQVQFMANIYANANRVIVWLGETAGDSDQALGALRMAAEERRTHSAIDKPNQHQQAILALLKRPWFRRIWVLQEVAAARHILIKCGFSEIDGYAFHLGLTALRPSYDAFPDLQGLIPPITYLIQGAIFRRGISQPGRTSLCVRPLSELVDMYHTREASVRLDKIYALLGMSSNDSTELSANYEASWRKVFRKFVQSSFSDRMSVDT